MYNILRGKRRILVGVLLATLALGSGAQEYPSRPTQMLVPFAAGGGLDLKARNLAEALPEAVFRA